MDNLSRWAAVNMIYNGPDCAQTVCHCNHKIPTSHWRRCWATRALCFFPGRRRLFS